jgi:transcription initiation factor TFIIIB Brf1 subunit/transcription initiation factor TFIIB
MGLVRLSREEMKAWLLEMHRQHKRKLQPKEGSPSSKHRYIHKVYNKMALKQHVKTRLPAIVQRAQRRL